MGGSAPAQAVGPPQVELRLAGAFGVARDGIELPDGQVGSRKSRTLLKLLAAARSAIARLLFPDGPAQNGLTYPPLAVLREPCVTFSQPNEVVLSVRAQFTLP